MGCDRPRRDHRFRPAGVRPRRAGPVPGRAHRDGRSLARLPGLCGTALQVSRRPERFPGRHVPAHRNEADTVIRRRIARAEGSNLAGWRMIADASARLSLPHLPGGLATRLAAAKNDPVRRARLLAEATAGFAGRPDDFGSALAENRDQAGRFPGWPVTLIRGLGQAGQGAEAVMLSEALAVVDPARQALFTGE